MSRDAVYKYLTSEQVGLRSGRVEDAQYNTDRINAALRWLSRTDQGVYILPRRIYHFTGRVIVDSCLLFGDVGSRMIFSDGTESPNVGVFLRGYLPKLKGLDVVVQGATVRRARECIWVQNGTTGHTIDHVRVVGCSGAGFFVDGGAYGQIRHCGVKDNLADGFHHTNGSMHCEVEDCSVDGSGDDYFAVVSYRNQGRVCRNIHYRRVFGNNQHHGGRGVTVVGGDNITYKDFEVRNVKGYGVYVFAESSYNTYGNTNVLVERGTIDGTGIGTSNPTQWAAVRIGDDNGQTVRNVRVVDMKLYRIGGPTVSIDNKPTVTLVTTDGLERHLTR